MLDEETGLVWARNADLTGERKIWAVVISYWSRLYTKLGNRKDWRLPTVEELLSLIDPSQSYPALPSGHPFINVHHDPSMVGGIQNDLYWTITTYETDSNVAWAVHMSNGNRPVW